MDNLFKVKQNGIIALFIVAIGMLTACGQKNAADSGESREMENSIIKEEEGEEEKEEVGGASDPGEQEPLISGKDAQDAIAEIPEIDDMKKMFGENCISEQTFEVALSGYDGLVTFVPFAPTEDNEEFSMKIMQGGEVLTEMRQFVPEYLEGKSFTSLDAVAFLDVNFDGYTDIVLIETYGDTSFAAIYEFDLGFSFDEYGSFYTNWGLSERISSLVDPLTISEIRAFLTDGKKNGEFSDYREAYETVSRLYEAEYEPEMVEYNLIYFDDDDIPEFVAGNVGYWTSLYTYHDGKVYALMDQWGYGAMGNHGYEYIPRGNRLRNYNSDYAGAIYYTTYMSISDKYTMDTDVSVKTNNFDDVNGDGVPNEGEEGSVGYYSASYIDDVEISNEEYAALEEGEYKVIDAVMSLEELKEALYSLGSVHYNLTP